MAVAAVVVGFGIPVVAQGQEALRQEQRTNELRTDWVTGTTVTTPDGETIGTVQGLLLDEEEGRVTAAIVAVGGFLGFGAKDIAVRWDELQLAYDASENTLDLTREQAEAAPEFAFRDRETPPPPPPTDAPMQPDMGTSPPPQ